MFRKIAVAAGLACWMMPATSSYYWPGHVYLPHDLMEIHGSYSRPDVASDARGNDLVVWSAESDDGTQDIYAAWLISNRQGEVTRLNTTTAGDQVAPAVAMDAEGGAVVVWATQVAGAAPGVHAIYGRRYFGVQAEPGSEFQINAQSVGSRVAPDVAMDAFGNFVVVWQRVHHGSATIFARRFASDGTPVGADFEVGAVSSLSQSRPAVAMSSWGEFVAVWEECDGANCDVVLRSFAADGTPDGLAVSVATPGLAVRTKPAISMDPHGGFVAAWNNKNLDGSAAIHARRFSPGGAPQAGEFAVNEASTDGESDPAVAVDATGDYSIIWEGPEWATRTLFLRLFARDGAPVTPELDLSAPLAPMELTTFAPSIAVDADGDAAVAHIQVVDQTVTASMVNLVGPEDVRAVLTVTDSVDPAVPGQPVEYRVAVRNGHEISTETGIPAIDSAIGLIGEYVAEGSVEWASHFTLPGACQGSNGYYWCPGVELAAGDTAYWTMIASSDQPTTMTHNAWLWLGQYSTEDGVDVEQTTVACAPGAGGGEFAVPGGPYSVAEGGSLAIEVRRVNGACGPASVRYEVPSTADIADVRGNLYWEHGDNSPRNIIVRTVQDDIDEDPQSLSLVLSSPMGAALGAPSSLTFTIEDDDATPTVSITPASQLVTEGAGNTATFAVTLSRASERASVPFVVSGTATPSVDYSVGSSSPLSFAGTRIRNIQVTYTNDSVYEQDETVVVTLGDSQYAVSTEPSQATLTIRDNDPKPQVRISTADTSVEEGTEVTVGVALSSAIAYPVTVPLQWSGAAALGSDLTAPTALEIPAGALTASFSVMVRADGLDEDDFETAQVTLGVPTNATLGADTQLTLHIADLDAKPAVLLTGADRMVREGEGSVTLTVELSAVSGREVRVSLTGTSDAKNPGDYSLSSTQFVIPAGASAGVIEFYITDDTAIELDEDALMKLYAPVNATLGSGANQAQKLTIRDNDPVPLDPVHDALSP